MSEEQTEESLEKQKELLLKIYQNINHPAQAGKVWVKYPREQIDNALGNIKEMMTFHGFYFKPLDQKENN